MKKVFKLIRPTFFAASITTTYAVSGGNITSDGGAKVTDWGVIWSTTEDPTGDYEQIVISGDAGCTGIFTCNLSGLFPGTTYFVKAYATNESGFTALPGGIRSENGFFNDIGMSGIWWYSVHPLPTESSEYVRLFNNNGGMYFSSKNENRSQGLAVRCVMDN